MKNARYIHTIYIQHHNNEIDKRPHPNEVLGPCPGQTSNNRHIGTRHTAQCNSIIQRILPAQSITTGQNK